MDDQSRKFEIRATPDAKQSEILIDGKHIRSLLGYELRGSIDEATVLEIKHHAVDVSVHGSGLVVHVINGLEFTEEDVVLIRGMAEDMRLSAERNDRPTGISAQCAEKYQDLADRLARVLGMIY